MSTVTVNQGEEITTIPSDVTELIWNSDKDLPNLPEGLIQLRCDLASELPELPDSLEYLFADNVTGLPEKLPTNLKELWCSVKLELSEIPDGVKYCNTSKSPESILKKLGNKFTQLSDVSTLSEDNTFIELKDVGRASSDFNVKVFKLEVKDPTVAVGIDIQMLDIVPNRTGAGFLSINLYDCPRFVFDDGEITAADVGISFETNNIIVTEGENALNIGKVNLSDEVSMKYVVGDNSVNVDHYGAETRYDLHVGQVMYLTIISNSPFKLALSVTNVESSSIFE